MGHICMHLYQTRRQRHAQSTQYQSLLQIYTRPCRDITNCNTTATTMTDYPYCFNEFFLSVFQNGEYLSVRIINFDSARCS